MKLLTYENLLQQNAYVFKMTKHVVRAIINFAFLIPRNCCEICKRTIQCIAGTFLPHHTGIGLTMRGDLQ